MSSSRVSNKILAHYGSWKSAINAKMLLGGNCKGLVELQVSSSGRAFWVEQTFPTGKRILLAQPAEAGAQPKQWSTEEISVANSVHEYGGGSFCLSKAEKVYVCHDGGLSEVTVPGEALCNKIVKDDSNDIRHADPFVFGQFVYVVKEIHDSTEVEPRNCLVRVHLETLEMQTISTCADFYAEPRVSPDGRWLAWIQWNKPFMPWDQTSVYIAELLEDGKVMGAPRELLAGSSTFGLQWANSSKGNHQPELFVVSDASGFWNVYELDYVAGKLGRNVHPIDKDIGEPLWNFADDRPFAIVSPTQIVLSIDDGLFLKSLSDPNTPPSSIDSVKELGFSVFHHLCCSNGSLFFLASGPTRSKSLVRVDMDSLKAEVIRETRSYDELRSLNVSIGQLMEFDSDGVKIQGYFYPPNNSEYSAPEGTLPPVIFLAHVGPTAKTTNAFDLKKQYFTSRGFAIFDINYRGSSGFGRDFRNLLLGNWGVVDRDDMFNGASFLTSRGLVDPKKMCIMGSSAGGFLALSTLFHPRNPFSAAVSIYGVSDVENLYKASKSHKFEAEYTTRLVAPYPEAISVYRERSAIHNLDKLKTPVAFIHGTDDRVVPCSESQTCYEKLKAKGVPTALKLFPGEGHGFRSAEAVTQTTDISYYFLCRVLGITPSIECDGFEIDNL